MVQVAPGTEIKMTWWRALCQADSPVESDDADDSVDPSSFQLPVPSPSGRNVTWEAEITGSGF